MPRAPRASSSANALFDSQRQPWFVQILSLVFLTAVAYVLAVVIYIVAFRLVQIPKNELIDDSVRPAFLYIVLMIVIGACLLPMFNREWDATLRRFGLLVAIFVVLFTGGESIGIFSIDPQGSLVNVIHGVTSPFTKHIPHGDR